MLIQMDETRIGTLEEVERFLYGAGQARPILQGSKDDSYAWIERTLVRFSYMLIDRKGKGIVRRYIMQLSGYSRQQITRLISQYRKSGHIRRRQRTVKGFETKYTRSDIQLLAMVDRLVDDVSGTTTKSYCKRAYEVFHDQRFVRLAGISVSHIYNLRGGKVYQRVRRKFTKTKSVKVNIGQRCKPRPNGEPGHLRVDSVHQGDMDGKKGVYHINSVDEVTQWEIVVTVEQISEQFMIPALKTLLDQFPFVIKGFHSDNGSEYINRHVANLLNSLMIRLTKSRSRHSNDNALAESKNNSVVRKTFGYTHIPQQYAELMEQFNRKVLNPCLNFHRPCHFPTIETDSKGKQKKRYHQKGMMTPYEKLRSLPNAKQYLKANITFEMLEAIAMRQTDLDAWEQMQKARNKLFDIIFKQPPQVA
ncbi:MAG: transposase family protein [Planctomycetes bacterium]|nr:transposase family protein [Planctomycetota bacterium]